MTEAQAQAIAEVYGGVVWQPHPGLWVVLIERDAGRLILCNDDGIYVYDSREAFESTMPTVALNIT